MNKLPMVVGRLYIAGELEKEKRMEAEDGDGWWLLGEWGVGERMSGPPPPQQQQQPAMDGCSGCVCLVRSLLPQTICK